ncbi:B12-binding domain-containing radical SAM protein [Indioceanicola profundi]|uniref:B12-binding domain-containing radical SAM protein n=1 Tax=Indioceanicola profundi TaxID=2220096 RepID=UPI000E6ADFB1|nr:radical SAM protein [Indioceanicola profundi]
MTKGQILFVQPPASFSNPSPCLDDKQFGLGILANAAWLQGHGFAVDGIHIPLMLHQGFSAEDAISLILAKEPILVAIGLNWVHFSHGALETARRLRERSQDLPIVIGGQHAGLFADEIAALAADWVNGVIRGEAEVPLLRLAEAISTGGGFPTDVPGLHTGRAPAPPPKVVDELDSLPVYSYRSLKPRPLRPDVAAISTARGACPFRCAWCIEPVVGRMQGRPKLRFHSPDRIVDQIEALTAEGITRFTIQDNFFVGGDRKLVALADALIRRAIRPGHLNIFAHPDSFTAHGMSALAACCELGSIDYGIETGSARVAAINNRRLNPDEVVERVASAASLGLEPYSWWMAGLPGEDEAALSETEELIGRTMDAGGIPRWVSPLILFPQTDIHLNPERYGVRRRFEGFADYAIFSEISLAEAVMFSEAVAHETAEATRDEITAAALRLRRFIVSNLHRLHRAYEGAARPPDLAGVEARIRQSFM